MSRRVVSFHVELYCCLLLLLLLRLLWLQLYFVAPLKEKKRKETKRNCFNQLGTYSVDDAVINLDCLSILPLSLAAR